MFFIIFGTRGVTSTKEQGEFNCPSCGPMNYRLKVVRRFFTLYFIPLIPLDSLGRYVECAQCQGTFNENVLSYQPSDAGQQMQALFMIAMKQVMIGMLLADGVIDDAEVKELQDIFEELAGVEVTEEDLREEIDIVERDGSSCLEMVSKAAPHLNDSGKEKVIRAAYRIAMADGVFDESESEFLSDLSAAMDLSAAHLRGIMTELME